MRRSYVITAGRGPVECRRAVRMVRDALLSEAEEMGFELDEIRGLDPDGEGPFSTRLIATGQDGIEVLMGRWLGTIKCVMRSERRSKDDRKNWFVGVREELGTTASIAIDEADVEFSAMTAGGPGGQHQNKTASAVRAVHRPTGIAVVVRSDRSQHRNRKLAVERLASILSARTEDERTSAERRNWSERIAVERGRPVRTLEAR